MEELKKAVRNFLEDHTLAELIELLIETIHEERGEDDGPGRT